MFVLDFLYSKIKEEFQKNFTDLVSNHLSDLNKGSRSCADFCVLLSWKLLDFDFSHLCSSCSVVQGEGHSRERDHPQHSPEDI